MKAKTLFSMLFLCIAGWAGAAGAVDITAYGPIWDDANARVTHTTYYSCNGSYHGALDIGNATCGTWNMRGMLAGTRTWNVVTGYSNCASTPQTPANYVYTNLGGGHIFYQYHHNHSPTSYTQTCDRCALGLVGATGQAYGAHVHGQHNYNGTAQTAWYSGYVTCGTKSSGSLTMGVVRI